MACSTDADCQSAQGPGTDFVCACPGQVTATGTDTAQTCVTSGSCDPSVGHVRAAGLPRRRGHLPRDRVPGRRPTTSSATRTSTHARSPAKSARSSLASTRTSALSPTTASRWWVDENRNLLAGGPRRPRRSRSRVSGRVPHDRRGEAARRQRHERRQRDLWRVRFPSRSFSPPRSRSTSRRSCRTGPRTRRSTGT